MKRNDIKKGEIPAWKRYALTIEEAAKYFETLDFVEDACPTGYIIGF